MIRTVLALLLLIALPLLAVDVNDTRMLGDPAVSPDRIAFAYANDLWTARHDGSGVQRLTSHAGIESSPRFSPDGSLVAFTGRYEGNGDVYVVPASGGEPKRLTWHPQNDTVLGFTADGRSVLFASAREVHTPRFQQLFTVPVAGGAVTKLPIPTAFQATISPDGKLLAYVPLREAFLGWKRYRGGTTARILVVDLATLAQEQVPQPEGRSNDTDPMWLGNTLYFRSDRDGEFNLYSYDRGSKQVARQTSFTDHPILNATAGAGRIAFEQAGYVHLFDPATKKATRLKIGVATDLAELRPRFVKGAKYVRNASLSPSGQRAAFELRGEIVTVPAEKGDDRNLTQSPGANDRAPVWSPDGKWIAWFTDETGEYELRIAPQEGRGTLRKIKVTGAGYYERPLWSPDGKSISYFDNSHTLYILDVASGTSTKISSHVMYRPEPVLDHSWSPDSKWLAYTRTGATNMNTLHLWSAAEKKSYALTDGLSDAREPLFDPNGKYLYFVASTNAGPTADWFSMSTIDMRQTNAIYLAVLPKGVPSPLAKESDEEAGTPAETATAATEPAKKEEPKKEESKKPVTVTVDFARFAQHIQALPLPSAYYTNLQIATTGQLHYLKRTSGQAFSTEDPGALARFDLTKRKEDTLLDGVHGYELSRDGKRVLLRMKDAWSVADAGDKLDPAKRRLGIDKVEVRIDPRAEWKQIFDESYRLHRDWFYDPNYHGANLPALKEKYAPFLEHLTVRNDLNRLMQWFGSELTVGHFYLGGGDTLADVEVVKGGLLGADYAVDQGRYRFKKVYGGLNWNPELRAPLTEPGVDVMEGEYLLAVDGKDLKYPENLYARFERTAGRFTEITVGPAADGKNSRTVQVVPIESESSLRNRDWVERNLRYVTEKSGGRVAYVWVPDTGGQGHEYFKRYFFPQANREAIIIDERYNGGGLASDYYIDILRRPLLSFWATRYGADMKNPLASIQGPKAMLIDENAGSGGDYLPWSFKKLGLGPLIGRRTWGGLVGILGYPALMDGGEITSPNFAYWTEEGFGIENVGVPPDIEVEITPADWAAGRDPQLDKALEVVMQQLQANPPQVPKRPQYPVRVTR
ncbi:MAG TPA: PDZ domain-containing protein [Thermoanaerobaculia bacterium]|nr:PDZ domain-containing protein [Thermoanaerobaculia bacterium]